MTSRIPQQSQKHSGITHCCPPFLSRARHHRTAGRARAPLPSSRPEPGMGDRRHRGSPARPGHPPRQVIHALPRCAPTATPPLGPGWRLTRQWPAVRWHARQAARRSSLERIVPAIASLRNVRTGKARQPGSLCLPGTPRRPRARIDHTSHSSPATCHSVAGSRPLQRYQYRLLTTSICFPRPGRSRGHRAPAPGPELACAAGRYHRASAT